MAYTLVAINMQQTTPITNVCKIDLLNICR